MTSKKKKKKKKKRAEMYLKMIALIKSLSQKIVLQNDFLTEAFNESFITTVTGPKSQPLKVCYPLNHFFSIASYKAVSQTGTKAIGSKTDNSND